MHERKPGQSDVGVRARTLQFEQQFTTRLCDIIGSDLSSHVAELIRNGKFDEYLALKLDPERYEDPKHFAEDYLVASVLRKSKSLPLGVDVEDVARRRFIAAETRNASTNQRLWCEPLPSWWGNYSQQLLTILGPCNSAVLENISQLSKHGNGASVGVKGDGVVASDKYDKLPTCTPAWFPFLASFLPEGVREYVLSGRVKQVQGSVWFSVPKDAQSNRSCAKEPTWNLYAQAGIGLWIRKRLRRFGVDLRSQERNRYLASVAQREGLATIDLSQASDLNARNNVYLALCYNKDPQGLRWYHLLNAARSHQIAIRDEDGRVTQHGLEMFSSMGNGFTFPLETSIFLAMARTIVPPDELGSVAVYGDDIIVPQQYAKELCDRLEFVGFQVNHSKTCLAGKFFESCGTDWFDSQNVRPFYTRTDEEEDFVPPAVNVANQLRFWLLRVYGFSDKRYLELWQWVCDQVPRPWNNMVPPSLGATGIVASRDERHPPRPAKDNTFRNSPESTWEGWVCKHVSLIPECSDKGTYGVLLAALAQLERRPDRWGGSIPAIGRRWRASAAGFGEAWPPAILEAPWTLGLEPRRGYLGRISTTKTVVTCWADDFSWV